MRTILTADYNRIEVFTNVSNYLVRLYNKEFSKTAQKTRDVFTTVYDKHGNQHKINLATFQDIKPKVRP